MAPFGALSCAIIAMFYIKSILPLCIDVDPQFRARLGSGSMQSLPKSRGVSSGRRPRSRTPSAEPLEPRWLLSGAYQGRLAGQAHPAVKILAHTPAEIRHVRQEAARIDPTKTNSQVDTVLHTFGGAVNGVPDGWQPWGSLTPVKTSSGLVIFGRTTYGGQYGDGVLFKMNPSGSGYTIVHAFAGTSNGDGANPHHDEMRQEGNTLYGTTLVGGTYNQGIIFSINTDGTDYKVLYSFGGGTGDGEQPHSSPTPHGPVLYGLTAKGGADDEGVIYQINTNGSGFKVLYSFRTVTGSEPHGFVTVVGHDLYGMTDLGGAGKAGTVFRFDLLSHKYTVLHSFKGGLHDGALPNHGGLIAVGDRLYGLTDKGGRSNNGVLFEISTDGMDFKILHAFGKNTDGANPRGSLTLYGNRLYGMTTNGGAAGFGTVFSVSVKGCHYQTLYSFQGPTSDGVDGLDNVFISNGVLYGMTMEGGPGTAGGSAIPMGSSSPCLCRRRTCEADEGLEGSPIAKNTQAVVKTRVVVPGLLRQFA